MCGRPDAVALHSNRLHSNRIGDHMRPVWIICLGWICAACLATDAAAQTPLTWAEVRGRFEANNPSLRAARLAIDESRAQEVTAFLRPNPELSVTNDQMNLFRTPDE